MSKKDWKESGLNVKDELVEDHISIVSAGVAFYFFLALFPTLIAAISIFGLMVDPQQIQQIMIQFASTLPKQASQVISDILKGIAGQSDQTLGWGIALSLLFSLWAAHKGTRAVFEGINIAYDEVDDRGFFKKNGITLLFTIGGIIVGAVCLALVVLFPLFTGTIQLPSFLQTIIVWLRWPIMAAIVIGILAVTYKVAPARPIPKFSWVTRGAVIAVLLWLPASLLFTFYINNFSSYSATYGSLAAVIILMLWFFITAFVILLGAEINSEIGLLNTKTDRDKNDHKK